MSSDTREHDVENPRFLSKADKGEGNEQSGSFRARNKKKFSEYTWFECILFFFVVVVFVCAAASMKLRDKQYEKWIIGPAGAITAIILAPYLFYQQTQLHDIRRIKELKNKLKEEVESYTKTNNEVQEDLEKLGATKDQFEGVQDAMDWLDSAQDKNFSEFQDQVKACEKQLLNMQETFTRNACMIVSELLLKAHDLENNESMRHSSDLVGSKHDRLENIKHHLSYINGVIYDENKFEEKFREMDGNYAKMEKLLSDENCGLFKFVCEDTLGGS